MDAPRRGTGVRAAGVALALALALAVVLGALLPARPATGQEVRELVASGLEWPVSFVVRRDGRIYYNERYTGNLRVLVDGVPSAPLGNMTVVTAGEQGLLGLALDPAFDATPWAYLYHTYFNGSRGEVANRVVRLWLGPVAPPDPPVPETVLDGIPASTFHNGGVLGFGPDGLLYITTGDAGNSQWAQDNASLAGKVLRVNPDGTVPNSNPIPGNPVFTLGHRNVFGLAFHPTTGVPYVSENGPGDSDEVNRLVAGLNYGWPIVRGDAGDARFVDPVVTYVSVIAPTGLAFSTGSRVPAWRDDLILGDWNRGALQRLELGGPGFSQVLASEVVDAIAPNGILDVEDAPDGYLYVSTPDAIYRYREGTLVIDGVGLPLAVVAVCGALGALVLGFLLVVLWQRRRARSPPPTAPPAAPPPGP